MMGTQPLAIPTSFENTRFPSVEERLKKNDSRTFSKIKKKLSQHMKWHEPE